MLSLAKGKRNFTEECHEAKDQTDLEIESRFTKELSFPNPGFRRILGWKLMRKLPPVCPSRGMCGGIFGSLREIGYFTAGHRMTEEELQAVQGRTWEE
jgi:hypothetical protein